MNLGFHFLSSFLPLSPHQYCHISSFLSCIIAPFPYPFLSSSFIFLSPRKHQLFDRITRKLRFISFRGMNQTLFLLLSHSRGKSQINLLFNSSSHLTIAYFDLGLLLHFQSSSFFFFLSFLISLCFSFI